MIDRIKYYTNYLPKLIMRKNSGGEHLAHPEYIILGNLRNTFLRFLSFHSHHIFILQVRKLRPRKIKHLAQDLSVDPRAWILDHYVTAVQSCAHPMKPRAPP